MMKDSENAAHMPVDPLLPRLQTALARSRNVVLQADPGAGKTTRVPLALRDSPWLAGRKIVMLEPRRVVARNAARYMAGCLGEAVGGTVGYRVRLDARTSAHTRIEVVTEGVLTRMLQADPALADVGLVIFDEFHERNLNSDLGLALCLDSQSALRDDLRILVMSATLETDAVAQLMGGAEVLRSKGRCYPVTVNHCPLPADPVCDRRRFYEQLARFVARTMTAHSGSALVFLPGKAEIDQVAAALTSAGLDETVSVIPLHGQLDPRAQDRAVAEPPPGRRKVVLATAIAETSLTIEGVRLVFDSGLMRKPRFDPGTGLTRLVTVTVSEAAAQQRCGRAGRIGPGMCFRFWPQDQVLLAQSTPEILEADLAPLMLELKCWGVSSADPLRWLDPPPSAHLAQAQDLLHLLGAVDSKGRITAHGEALAALGVHPRLAHMMIRGMEDGCGALACELAALLSERDPLRRYGADSDVVTRVEVLRGWRACREDERPAVERIRAVAGQWRRRLGCPPPPADGSDLPRSGILLSLAYPDRIARRRRSGRGRFVLSSGRGAFFSEPEALAARPWIVAAHLDGEREARIFLAAAIDQEDLLTIHKPLLRRQCRVYWDNDTQSVQAKCETCLGKLTVDEQVWRDAPAQQVLQALLEGLSRSGFKELPWTKEARSLAARVNFLHRLEPEHWPDFSLNRLCETAAEWLAPCLVGMTRLAQVQKVDLAAALRARLSWSQQQRLQEWAPSHITVPSGSRIAINYDDYPPVLAVRLQEMFGWQDTPRLAGGRVPVRLHLLSPARRVVQITDDLAGFWKNAYFEIKKDLKGRYPKHYWPDDPWRATATSGTRPGERPRRR